MKIPMMIDDHEEGLRGKVHEGLNEGIDDEEGEDRVQVKEIQVKKTVVLASNMPSGARIGRTLWFRDPYHGTWCSHV